MKKKLFAILTVLAVVSLLLPAVAGAEIGALTGGGTVALTPLLNGPAEGVELSIAPQTGKASFVWLTADQAARIKQKAGVQGGFEEQAGVFFGAYGNLFGIRDTEAELVLAKTIADNLGTTHLSYDQVYKGVPVFAGILRVHFNNENRITAANGTFIPNIAVNPTPTLSPSQAAAIAEADIAVPGAVAGNITLYVYRENLARGIPGPNHLAFEVVVSDGMNVREFVYVDAHNGAVIDRLAGIYDIDREVYNQAYDDAALIWQEGDALPFYSEELSVEANHDANRVIEYVEDTYDMVLNATGGTYLSYDGADATMKQVIDDRTPDFCPNASWNGQYVRYCEGITGDDTVAHEWGHAYTQFTHKLVYAWQSGAINESYSDIYGEVVDMINGVGLDEPGGLRTDGACSVYTPLPVALQVVEPESLAGDYAAGPAMFGPPIDGTLEGSLVVVDDGTGNTSTEGCFALINDLTGKIAFIRRGTCNFTVKVKNAQDAGAIGAIIANHMAGGDSVFTMAGDDPTITIQSLLIGYTDGNNIEAEILGGSDVVTRFIQVLPEVEPDDSYRWLSGEDDPGFNGAIRDLWNPSCYGDPDKVTSEDFTCGTDDRGGVHSNSGVPNHAFALLVDGGNFNGQSVTGIGLTKAFHFYWRAQYLYQVPTTIFADHADALQQSCSELVGVNVLDLTTGEPSGEIVTEADCGGLAKVITAVELYEDPLCRGTPQATYRYRINIQK